MKVKVMMYKDNLYFFKKDLELIKKALEWFEGSHDIDIAENNSVIVTGSSYNLYYLLYALTSLEEVECVELS